MQVSGIVSKRVPNESAVYDSWFGSVTWRKLSFCVIYDYLYEYDFEWRKHKNMSQGTGNRINTNYGRVASLGGCQCWTGDPRILDTPLVPCCYSQRLKHSAMTHPSKTELTSWEVSYTGYNSKSILGRDDSPLGCLYEGNMKTCLRALAARFLLPLWIYICIYYDISQYDNTLFLFALDSRLKKCIILKTYYCTLYFP